MSYSSNLKRFLLLKANPAAGDSVSAFVRQINSQLHEAENRLTRGAIKTAEEPEAADTSMLVLENEKEILPLGALPEGKRGKLCLVARLDTGSVEWHYEPTAFRSYAIAVLARCFGVVLENMMATWDLPLRDLRLMTKHEEDQLLVNWNQTSAPFEENACIHQLFEKQAKLTPEAVAVLFRDERWTYQELDARANLLAQRLLSAGIQPGALVAVALPRSLHLVAALLAVLKVGAAYVPLDPAYPMLRITAMLEDANPAGVFVSRQTREKIPTGAYAVLNVEDTQMLPSSSPGRVEVSSSNPAYVIYTSGSTGKPKGVIVTHRNVANFFTAMDLVIGKEPGVWLAVTSISFDISVFELFWTLTRGYRVVIQEEGQLASPTDPAYSLAQQVLRHGVTHLQCTPTLASMIVRDPDSLAALGILRRLIVGGEALAPELARQLAGAVPGEVFNMYGPTETTIWSVAARIKPNDERVVIGRPIANTQLYILDPRRGVVPMGFPGELYIGGDGVAPGYLHRSELTAERFISNPFLPSGGKLYRTGDMVRYEPDGSLEFLGRGDQQIKIRGFRIELGEIEVALREHPLIRDAVVVVRSDSQDETDKRLVAYVIAAGRGEVVGSEVRAWLRGRLPEAMVPVAVMVVNHFPQTPNGKLDKNALPTPEIDPPSLPAGDVEATLKGMWQRLLGVENVQSTSDFFELGGHSLIAVRLFGEIRDTFHVDLGLATLFKARTLISLAARIQESLKPVAEGLTSSLSCLVPIRPEGSNIPFFCIHGYGGNLLNYEALVRYIPPNQPVYGMQSRGLDGSPPDESVETMARRYIEELRQVQLTGPYFVGGHSFGGLVAYEMACQLEASGERVGSVVLIDSLQHKSPPEDFLTSFVNRTTRSLRRVKRRSQRFLSRPDRLDYLKAKAAALIHGPQHQPSSISGQLAGMSLANLPPEVRIVVEANLHLPKELQNVVMANLLALNRFQPRSSQFAIVLFRCTTREIDDHPDFLMGWRHLAQGPLQLLEVPGDHHTMMGEPHAKALAEKLTQCLLAATANKVPDKNNHAVT